jgi:hypothetical protein
MLRASCDTDQASTGAQGSLSRQPCSAWHAGAASNDEHVAIEAFVSIPRSARKRFGQLRSVHSPGLDRYAFEDLIGRPEGVI